MRWAAADRTVQTILAIASSDVEQALRSAGGAVESFRALAERLGRPKSSLAVECHRLAGPGVLALAKNGRATRVALVARAN